MTSAGDTFAAFLTTMADTLELGSEERARRLHLSRFHLDRIVSAASTSPERRRRRVLLERAARRVIVLGAPETCGITDLDAGDPADWVGRPACS